MNYCLGQGRVLLTLCERYQEHSESESPVVYERSLRVAREVFMAQSVREMGIDDFAFLSALSRFGERLYETRAFFVYLSCTDKEMVERISARDRESERNARSEGGRMRRGKKLILDFFSFDKMLLLKRVMDVWGSSTCHLQLSTSGKTPEQVAREISSQAFV